MSQAEIIVIVVSTILAAAWIPVGIHFWRSWRQRGSPLSLAICGLIGFPIFTNVSSAVFLGQQPALTVDVLVGTNFLLLLNFILCFKWQKDRFPESRSNSLPLPASPPDYWKSSSKDFDDVDEEATTPPR